jgi:integrase
MGTNLGSNTVQSPKMRRDGLHEVKRTVNGKRRSFYGATKEVAELRADQAQGITFRQGMPSLRRWVASVYRPKVENRSESWKRQIIWALDGWIYPTFGNRQLDEISRADVQHFLTFTCGKLSRNSQLNIRKVFHAVMELAVDDDLIAKNPVRKVEVAPRRTKDIQEVPDIRQCREILERSKGTLVEGVVYAALTLGLRKSEILGLDWKDLRDGDLHITRQKLRNQYGSLKTLNSLRVLPLPDGWSVGERGTGQMIKCSDATIGRNREVIGVPLHRLRSAFSTGIESLGCPRNVTQAILGHSTGSVTDLYARVNKEVIRKWLTDWLEMLEKPSKMGDL